MVSFGFFVFVTYRCSQAQNTLNQLEGRCREESSRLNAEAQRANRLENQLREAENVVDQLRSRNAALESMNQELKTSIRRCVNSRSYLLRYFLFDNR